MDTTDEGLEKEAEGLRDRLLDDCDCEFHTGVGRGDCPEKLNCSKTGIEPITDILRAVRDAAIAQTRREYENKAES